MKKILLPFVLVCNILHAQVPSDCTVPQMLSNVYERDIKNMAVRRMFEVQSADTAFVNIPQAWIDTVAEGLAAILNATSIPQRDSIFNLYCVHDHTTLMEIYNGILVQVDTSFSWTQAWQNLVAVTGNPAVDALVMNYDLTIAQFYNWSFGNFALIHTDSLWNIYALMDSLEMVGGILYAEPDAIIGAAGKIIFNQAGGERYYDFYFEFNDCFDGCDNYRDWKYKVNADCSVEYLGFEDWGAFGISPLPVPSDCNIFTSVTENTNELKFRVFPTPSGDVVTIRWNKEFTNPVDFILFDVSGREVKRTGNIIGTEFKIDISELPSSSYVFKIYQKGVAISSGKINKQ